MTDDWFDALVALLGARARFLVVGAHAVAVHGIPRGTQDLDIWIESSAENVRRVWEGLAAFGVMAFGDDDGVVDWDQGTEFYNLARRAGKQMVLLVYEGEDHGFRQEANQRDYHRRILEWFGHYLKGEPAPAWITEGVPLEDLEAEKKRAAGKGGG